MSRLKLLGKNIKTYREKKGYTQTNLAIKLGLAYETICRAENGKSYLSLKKLFEIADILEVDFCKLTDFK